MKRRDLVPLAIVLLLSSVLFVGCAPDPPYYVPIATIFKYRDDMDLSGCMWVRGWEYEKGEKPASALYAKPVKLHGGYYLTLPVSKSSLDWITFDTNPKKSICYVKGYDKVRNNIYFRNISLDDYIEGRLPDDWYLHYEDYDTVENPYSEIYCHGGYEEEVCSRWLECWACTGTYKMDTTVLNKLIDEGILTNYLIPTEQSLDSLLLEEK